MSDQNRNRPSVEEIQARGLAAIRADPTLAALVGMQGFDSQAALAVARMHHVHQLSQLGGLGDLALLQGFGGAGLLGRHGGGSPETPSRKLSRTEKKRNREQQRRHEVNEGFDALIDLLRRIEPKFRTGSRKPAFSAGADMDEHTITNRVDLLDYTMKLLQHLHDENESKKDKIKGLLIEQATKKATEEARAGTGDTNEEQNSSAEEKETKKSTEDNSSAEDVSSNDPEAAAKSDEPAIKTGENALNPSPANESLDSVVGPVMGLPDGGAGDFETAMGLLGSRLGGVPSALELAAARSSAFQRVLMASNPMLMQRDSAAFLGGGGSAALAQQQFFAGLAGPSSLAYQQLLMGAGTGLGLSGMKRPAEDIAEEKGTGEKSTGEQGTGENG